MMVLATTPSWLMNLSYLSVSSSSCSSISTAFLSRILALGRCVSLAFMTRGISIVSCTVPSFTFILSPFIF